MTTHRGPTNLPPPRTVDLVAVVQHGRLYFGARSPEAIVALETVFPDAPWPRDEHGTPYCATEVRVSADAIVWVAPLTCEGGS